MRLASVEVFKFEELPEEGKKAVRKYFNESDIEANNEAFDEIANEVLAKLFTGKITDLSYSLSHSQGDGLSFMYSMTYDEVKVFLSYVINFSESKEKGEFPLMDSLVEELNEILVKKYDMDTLLSFLDASTDYLEDLRYYTEANSYRNRYSHARTVDHEVEYAYRTEGTTEETQFSLRAWQLRDIIRELYLSICSSLETAGYEIIYYERTDEELKEMCNSNDYEFTADGKLF